MAPAKTNRRRSHVRLAPRDDGHQIALWRHEETGAVGPVSVNGVPLVYVNGAPLRSGDIEPGSWVWFNRCDGVVIQIMPHPLREAAQARPLPPKIITPDQAREMWGEKIERVDQDERRYVVGFLLEQLTSRVLLIRKRKPSWQAGMLNGPGGKVEPNEAPLVAMIREWSEEIGDPETGWDWSEFARLGGDVHTDPTRETCVVHCFRAETRFLPRDSGVTDTGEAIETVHLHRIFERRDLISKLYWLLPLAFYDHGRQMVTTGASV